MVYNSNSGISAQQVPKLSPYTAHVKRLMSWPLNVLCLMIVMSLFNSFVLKGWLDLLIYYY